MGVMLKAENVAIRYITGDFKDIGLKEYTMRRLTGNYQVKEFMAVDGVSFELNDGDMLGIVGSNGAGKSTLLKAVAGIMEPTRGKITANGDVAALLELGSGFDGDLTVKENAYLRGAMLGYTKEFMDSTYEQIIDFAELKEFENRPFKQLSSGMKSRLAFSIASLVKPDILILDEVLSVGDGAFQEKSAKKMREIISQGVTTILVSHSLAQIRELCNKVLWLDHGRQVAFGDSAEICDRYEAFLRGKESSEEQTKYVEKKLTEQECDNAENKQEIKHKTRSTLFSNPRKVWGSIICLGLCALLVVLLASNLLKQSVNTNITIRAEMNTGNVVFRGAMVDDNWYSPTAIVTDSGSWILDDVQVTFSAVDESELVLHLPLGSERSLVFTTGPDAGEVWLSVNDIEQNVNLYQEELFELGQSFELPKPDIDAFGLNKNAAVFLVIFTLLMLVYIWGFRVQESTLEKNTSVKNSAIEAFRFFIIISVVIHHYKTIDAPAGYLGVDFFFILSGFLLMRHYLVKSSNDCSPAIATIQYTKGRYFRLLPYYLLAFLLGIGLSVCLWTNKPFAELIVNNIWELLMLEAAGFNISIIVGPGWYCSALIIAGFFVYYLLARYKETYLYFIAPIIFLAVFAWMWQHIGHLNRWGQVDILTYTGAMRGFAELGLGCICYKIYTVLAERFKDKYLLLSSIIELAMSSYIFYVIFCVGPSNADFITVVFMAVLITSLFIGNSWLSKILNHRLFGYLGTISISIYLNHLILAGIDWNMFFANYGMSENISYALYIVIVLIFSAISTTFVQRLIQKGRAAKGE